MVRPCTLFTCTLYNNLQNSSFLVQVGDVQSLRLTSFQLPDLPIPTTSPNVLCDGHLVYVFGGRCADIKDEDKVQVFNLEELTWTILPQPTPQICCQGVIINNLITLIGGWESGSHRVTNKLSTLVDNTWRAVFPPMPTKRIRPATLYKDDILIVAGGHTQDDITLQSIDVMRVTTKQWSTLVNVTLPRPLYSHQVFSCGDAVYICNGGYIPEHQRGKDLYTPLQSTWKMSWDILNKAILSDHPVEGRQWMELPCQTPFDASSSFSSPHSLFTVGGADSEYHPQSAVHIYSLSQSKWVSIGQLKVPRMLSGTVQLGERAFLVVGGLNHHLTVNKDTFLSSVEFVYFL